MLSKSWLSICCLFAISSLLLGCGAETRPSKETLALAPAAGGDVARQPEAAHFDGATPQRKVILKIDMEVRVELLSTALDRVQDLLQKHKSVITKSEEFGSIGTYRRATMTIRVPVAVAETLSAELRELGEVANRTSTSDDVTEQYVDLETRIKHWKTEEETYLKIMKDKSQTADDIIKFRTQLSSIRENIERMEAKFISLKSATDFSTIVLTLREREAQSAVVIEQPLPSFKGTFLASWNGLINLLKYGGVIFAGAVPWLPILMLFVIVYRWLQHRFFGSTVVHGNNQSVVAGHTLSESQPTMAPGVTNTVTSDH